MRNLSEIRSDIDKIDSEIIELFKKRMDCAKEVGVYKKSQNTPVLNQGLSVNRQNRLTHSE